MLIHNIVLGKNEDATTNVVISKDDRGNTFVESDSTFQKIRLGNNVPQTVELVSSAAFAAGECSSYKIGDNLIISQNKKNMNLSLYPNKKDEEEKNELMFVVLSNNSYTMVEYRTNDNAITNTYRKKDSYNGIILKLVTLDDSTLMSLNVFDKESNRFVTINIIRKDGKICIEKNLINDKKMVSKLNTKMKALKNRTLHFKVNNIKKPVSNVYIVDRNIVDELNTYFSDNNISTKNMNIITVNTENDIYENNTEFEKVISGNHVRSVTLCGVKVPFDFCKNYGILYLFLHDIKNATIKTIKSN